MIGVRESNPKRFVWRGLFSFRMIPIYVPARSLRRPGWIVQFSTCVVPRQALKRYLMTTKTPKTLTLSTKKPRAEAAPLTVPKTTLSYVIDNAQEAAGKVTVVKKKTSRLAVLAGDE